MKGFRQDAQGSRKERLKGLETELKNANMASRISQMLTQQLMQNMQNMSKDIGHVMSLINEMQYKLLAIQEVAKLDKEAMNAVANARRLKDFEEASAKEDLEQALVEGTVIDANSTVVLTSKTEGTDNGIFRSRLKLSESGVPELMQAFEGRGVGAKAIVKLNGLDHEVEILAIRQPQKTETATAATATTQ